MLTKLEIIKIRRKLRERKEKREKQKLLLLKRNLRLITNLNLKLNCGHGKTYWARKNFLNKPSIDFLPQTSEVNKCEMCEKRIINEDSIVNTSWMHIYHADWLLNQCKRYLSKFQYPEDCPVKGWTKRLGPQEITRHLNSIDKIRYEAFSLLRSGQMNRLQILWCYKCRVVFAKKKNKDQRCYTWNEISYWFQDALKFL